MDKTVGIIPARFASTRFEGKVLKPICGKPMLQHVWESAKKAKLLDEVIIATDDERVKKVSLAFKAKVEMTAKEHSSGTDRIAEVVNPLDVKNVVNIQADEPLIRPAMIDSLVNALIHDKSIAIATLAKKITSPHELDDPNVVKVVKDKADWALYFSRSPIPYVCAQAQAKQFDHQEFKRHSAVVFYKHIGLYAYTKDFLFTFKKLPKSVLETAEQLEQLRVLENGYRIKIIETQFDTIGVDTAADLERVEEILSRK
jgi:3-deoxy-manno-octulosonate cytidylyltransferase (CMP-KDO synthetase)